MTLPDEVRGRFHEKPTRCPWCGATTVGKPNRAGVSESALQPTGEWWQSKLRMCAMECAACGKRLVAVYALVAVHPDEQVEKKKVGKPEDEVVEA